MLDVNNLKKCPAKSSYRRSGVEFYCGRIRLSNSVSYECLTFLFFHLNCLRVLCYT